jgi:hypothetical protein
MLPPAKMKYTRPLYDTPAQPPAKMMWKTFIEGGPNNSDRSSRKADFAALINVGISLASIQRYGKFLFCMCWFALYFTNKNASITLTTVGWSPNKSINRYTAPLPTIVVPLEPFEAEKATTNKKRRREEEEEKKPRAKPRAKEPGEITE